MRELNGKISDRRRAPRLFLAAALALCGAPAARAQSTDAANPTPMTASVVAGRSNGKARTHYYSFTATAADGGEVTVKVTASTDERSTNLRVNFLDDDGQKVMDEIYVIPNRDPATKVGRHTFAERQRVTMRVTLPEDPQVKLLDYRIEVTGAVEFETPPAADAAASTGEGPTQKGAGQEVTRGAKKAAGKAARETVNELPGDDEQ